MLSLILWWAGISLEAVILLRSIIARSFLRYPYFYTYLTCILAIDLTRYFVYLHSPSAYRGWYWPTEFVSVSIGYGVILEILRQALGRYQGVARFIRGIVWASLLVVLAYVAYKSATVTNWSAANTGAELKRDLRTVQAIVLSAILLLISHYRIELTRNLKGIIVGYGIFVAMNVVNLAVQAYAAAPLVDASRHLESYLFFFPLMVWTLTLWSYQPAPARPGVGELGSDYESFSRRTKGTLRGFRESYPWKLKE
jgi:hypothetical protein